jgi:hypothetical protein
MIREVCYELAAAFVALAAWRAAYLLVWRRPVFARVIGSDLTEMQRAYDADAYRMARHDQILTTEDVPWRPVLLRMAYEFNGIEHRGDIWVLADKGARPDVAQTIWVDPANPERASGIGPLWVTPLIVFAGMLVVAGSRLSL